MSTDAVWITDRNDLSRLLGAVGRGPIALYLEADSFHRYRERVCLLQLSFGGRNVLVDTLAGVDPSPLGPLLANPAVPKVMHGADYDLRLLHREFGLTVRGLFDTMIAARLAGESAVGLAALLERHFGVALDKRLQRADWSRRPLPDAMLRYAVEDTRHLEALADRLRSRLDDLERIAWAEEEFRRLEGVRWTSETPDPEAWRRVRGASRLDRREQTVLRELWNYRDGRARRLDVPPFRILRDSVLIALARRRPTVVEDLVRIPGLPRALGRARAAGALLRAIADGEAAPAVGPAPARRSGRRPSEGGERLERLRRWRDSEARRLGIEPSLLVTRRVLEGIVERLGSGRSWREVDDLRDWQADLLEPAIRELPSDRNRDSSGNPLRT